MFKPLILSLIILQNIYINGTHVGGLDQNAALGLLQSSETIQSQNLQVITPQKEYAFTFADFNTGYDFTTAINEALEYSAPQGFFKDIRKKRKLKSSPKNIKAAFYYDLEKISTAAEKIATEGCFEPKEPTYSINTQSQFTITSETNGQEINSQTLKTQIESTLQTAADTTRTTHKTHTIQAPVTVIPTKLTANDFQKATALIGTYTTPHDPNPQERATNLSIAANNLNNHVILPGETFSTCKALKPRTAKNGYVEAGQIMNGLPEKGIGGGICQIVGTLYMAALYAEMDITSRTNHTLMVGYMPPSTDATIAEGTIDLKLKNNSPYPMLVQSILSNQSHTINIFGYESRPNGRQIHFESELIETYHHEDHIIEDPDLLPGETQVLYPGLDGGKYALYKVITFTEGPNAGQTERVKINQSTYRPLKSYIKTGPAYAEPYYPYYYNYYYNYYNYDY
jgi:vancomycin resistance protein YoaR